MNRVTLALVVILAAFLLGGVGGWFLNDGMEPEPLPPIPDNRDSVIAAQALLIAEGEKFRAIAAGEQARLDSARRTWKHDQHATDEIRYLDGVDVDSFRVILHGPVD